MNIDPESLKRALNDAYLAGFNDSGEGYNHEYPFCCNAFAPLEDSCWVTRRDDRVRLSVSLVNAANSPENNT